MSARQRFITVCAGKIHRATVTEANLDYVGSITVDAELLRAAGIMPYQLVHINNVRNGAHWETYAVPGEAGSGVVCLNGPPAHHFQPGDLVIILNLMSVDLEDPIVGSPPAVVYVNQENQRVFK